MLKLIAGVMYPSKGSVRVNGEIAPLIELGAGFDMELTARENVYLNGAVLGHDRAYMDEHFKNIIDFAELWDFVDVPVKNYSSGMIARLGFSIATEVRADILACDEILSVGDFMFQQKCHDRMEQMLSGGTTLLFRQPRHQPGQAALQARHLDRPCGHLRGDGPSAEVCDAYVAAMQRGNERNAMLNKKQNILREALTVVLLLASVALAEYWFFQLWRLDWKVPMLYGGDGIYWVGQIQRSLGELTGSPGVAVLPGPQPLRAKL